MFGSISYSIPYENFFWSLIGPVRSADDEAETLLRLWHERKHDGHYFWDENIYTSDGHKTGTMRALFPENDSTSVDRLAKTILLAKHNRLQREAVAMQGYRGLPSGTLSFDQDYEYTWNQQSKSDRFWWTISHRRPYTYFVSLGKWGLEAAIIAGCAYTIYKFKNWYKNRNKQNQEKVSEASGILTSENETDEGSAFHH